MDYDHAGIGCSIADRGDVCAAIDTVVTVIRDKHPEDLDRLRDRVRHFELLTTAECEEGLGLEVLVGPIAEGAVGGVLAVAQRDPLLGFHRERHRREGCALVGTITVGLVR